MKLSDNEFKSAFSLDFPLIMAPMFLVSNIEMIKAAMRNGIMGVFPSLNFRDKSELTKTLSELSEFKMHNINGSYGVNLIVQKSNLYLKDHLDLCIKYKVPFFITSLGNPIHVIQKAHDYGAKVYCDVTNLEHANKCASLNCDGFIAVGKKAGGHAGPFSLDKLVPDLRKEFPQIPVIAAGGIATGDKMYQVMQLGASGVMMGTRFIASDEAGVSKDYKDAIVNAKSDDIVFTKRLSGTPCAVINTPYVEKLGTEPTYFESLVQRSTKLKGLMKRLIQYRGMKFLEKSVKPGNYNNIWSAGRSVEEINEILSIDEIIDMIKIQYTKFSQNQGKVP